MDDTSSLKARPRLRSLLRTNKARRRIYCCDFMTRAAAMSFRPCCRITP